MTRLVIATSNRHKLEEIRALLPGVPLLSLAELPRVADTGYWTLASGVYLAGGADWMTTRRFREQGIEEANGIMEPFVDDSLALAALKVSAGTLVNYASYRLKMNGRRYWAAPQIAWIVLNAAVSVHNQRQLDE